VEWSLIPYAEAVEHTTFSISFNIEVTNGFCGYVRFLHLDLAIRTVALTHGLIFILLSLHKKSQTRFYVWYHRYSMIFLAICLPCTDRSVLHLDLAIFSYQNMLSGKGYNRVSCS
jgi:hypothetical protein